MFAISIRSAHRAVSEVCQAMVVSWVHPSARTDAVQAARHASLIASHLIGGTLAAVVFAAYFAWTGWPAVAAVIAGLCFLSQFLIAHFASRTGRLDLAHFFASANLTCMISIACVLSGGSSSFAMAWLAIVPLEAALSTDRRVMVMATALAVAALLALHLATILDLLPPPSPLAAQSGALALVSHIGAAVYAGLLAASVQQLHRGAAQAIEQSRANYRLIAENANDLVTRHDRNGRISFASLASRRLLGVSPESLQESGLEPLLSADDRPRYAKALACCVESRRPLSEEFQVRGSGGDGDPIWIEMRLQPVVGGPDGAVATVIGVTRDITARKAELAEIMAARDEAERISRAKSAFLATMSHELRTPLNAIIGFSELLHRDLLIKSREPSQAEYCRIIHQSGEHLLSLVKDLLDVSKIESGKFSIELEPFDLIEVAPGAVETLRPVALRKGITLTCDIPEDLPDMLADRRAVRQIIINLVSNACKFTQSGGSVSVTARSLGNKIELTVADTGIGIAPEHLAMLGRPFYQVDLRYARQNEGAGLGLSIVRGLVELHNGEMTIESTVGRGSRFSVVLGADATPAVNRTAEVCPTADGPAPPQQDLESLPALIA